MILGFLLYGLVFGHGAALPVFAVRELVISHLTHLATSKDHSKFFIKPGNPTYSVLEYIYSTVCIIRPPVITLSFICGNISVDLLLQY